MWAITIDDMHDGPPGNAGARRAGQAPVSESGRTRADGRRGVRALAADPLRACVAGMCEGDQAALAQLYDATAGRLLGVVRRIVRQPELAEEVLADVYFQAWRDCARYEPARGPVIAWLLIICRTRSLDALRRRDEAVVHPEPEALQDPGLSLGSADAPDALLAALQTRHELTRALGQLTALQRQLIALAFFRGLSHAEIADHCGMPLGSVKTHLRRALKRLQEILPSPFQAP